MTNFSVEILYPWLFLLLLPALFLTLFPYFRLAKRYRKTRNRIVSMVLHMIIMTLCVTVLAGTTFEYDEPHNENEMIFLVDMSFSNEESDEAKKDFVISALQEGRGKYNTGIMLFGFDNLMVGEMTHDIDALEEAFIIAVDSMLDIPEDGVPTEGDVPDRTATNLQAALTAARGYITKPSTSKIVILSDGIETDGNSQAVIRDLYRDGIKVDAVYYSNKKAEEEVQLVEASVPDMNIKLGKEQTLKLSMQSSYQGPAKITVMDNGVEVGAPTDVVLNGTLQTEEVKHVFTESGLHEISFKIEGPEGTDIAFNNKYYTYVNIELFDQLLIIERTAGESEELQQLDLMQEFNITTVSLDSMASGDTEVLPQSIDELRMYDEVILVNISNQDLEDACLQLNMESSDAFIKMLDVYVRELGGGMFTVGGSKLDGGETVANTYNRADLYGTLYQKMLPVQAINYTPPVGVVIIIDCSGSMSSSDAATGKTFLEVAKDGALSCLEALTERDYCSVVALDDDYDEKIKMTSVTEKSKIVEVISNIESGGGTSYQPSIQRAGQTLKALSAVERRHVILVSDGQPSDPLWADAENQVGGYGGVIKNNFEKDGITFSMVNIGGGGKVADLSTAAQIGGGRYYDVWDGTTLQQMMREDISVPEIKDVILEPFIPEITDANKIVASTEEIKEELRAVRETLIDGVDVEFMPTLTGYYGTKIKSNAVEVLSAGFVPLYAQWRYGEGFVGSFMCDLNGTWSDELLSATGGKDAGLTFLGNAIKGVLPTESIRRKDITVDLKEDNYSNYMSVYTEMVAGDELTVTVTNTSPEATIPSWTQTYSATDDYSRINLEPIKESGTYEIVVSRKNSEGVEVGNPVVIYKSFSYSKEYNMFHDEEASKDNFFSLAEITTGSVIEGDEANAYMVYLDFGISTHKVIDPRLAFIITALVLFLLDIAVRKFKFKWIHELVRESKERKANRNIK